MIEPLPPPKSIDHKVRSVFTGRSRFRSTFLFDPTDVELLKNHFALFPYGLPTTHYVSRQQLVEGILKREFGHETSKQLLYRPCQRDMLLFLMKKKKKPARRENHVFRSQRLRTLESIYAIRGLNRFQ